MAKNKIDYKNIILQSLVGLVGYFLFFKGIKNEVKKPVLEVGNLEGLGLEYQAIWFKDSEYFKNFAQPDNYLKNWNKLKMVLDLIRIKFGSPVIITKGYAPSETGLITDTFQTCQSVEIYPQNNDVKGLKTIIASMVSSGEIVLLENIYTNKSHFKITING